MTSVYWPDTKIIKSTNNAFTQARASLFANDPGEVGKATLARKQAAADHSKEAQKARGTGFGHATLKGLSKRGKKLLNNAPQSITIGPRGSSRGDQIKRGGI
ncbi:hypothetical protein F3K02_09135 [Hydrogenophaga sp. D2P1]|uniref:Uncharacterized protein n=1 Tax=Hydrogenophaga aromaticivorans TaxID=2610898 RepID=A0A7Y8GV46_9BURK|nr:hypothetical protein [Hydrogenophaga aromaticivorans]NWF45409.1 hypothetical protein [Hydrogenophaga aromaticivorans]